MALNEFIVDVRVCEHTFGWRLFSWAFECVFAFLLTANAHRSSQHTVCANDIFIVPLVAIAFAYNKINFPSFDPCMGQRSDLPVMPVIAPQEMQFGTISKPSAISSFWFWASVLNPAVIMRVLVCVCVWKAQNIERCFQSSSAHIQLQTMIWMPMTRGQDTKSWHC